MALPKPITTEADVHAFRALFEGIADKAAQMRVVDWLAQATGRADVPYISGPDGERDTLVMIGRQQIGVMIGNMASVSFLEEVRKADLARTTAAIVNSAPVRGTSKRQKS